VRGRRSIALAGLGAGLLCNYWVLEAWLSERSDLAGSWISDLATRSEATGWRFVALGVLSGLAVATFALMLLRQRGERSPTLRRGLLALLAAGALIAIASAAPLSCPEGLEPSCSLEYDALDLVHSSVTLAESAATALAFALVGLGLLRLPRGRAGGRATLLLGALWLLLTLLTAVTYASADIDSVKGLLQRGGQILFGGWLALLGVSGAGAVVQQRAGPALGRPPRR
jgi:hypothetical protein